MALVRKNALISVRIATIKTIAFVKMAKFMIRIHNSVCPSNVKVEHLWIRNQIGAKGAQKIVLSALILPSV